MDTEGPICGHLGPRGNAGVGLSCGAGRGEYQRSFSDLNV